MAWFGVAEVWVVNARTLVTHVHANLGAEGYRATSDVASSETVTAKRAAISMNLAALGLTPVV